MKKYFALAVAVIMLSVSLVSCGGTFSYADTDLAKYVTAGEFKNLTVTIPVVAAIDDAAVDAQIASDLTDYNTKEEVSGGCSVGDTVNIDYVGKIDGVEFENGSATGSEFVLGQGGLIDGFEDAIVGMAATEKKTIDVTFPDPYENNPDIAGKAAQFDITMNGVYNVIPAELTDEIVVEISDDESVATVADYRAKVKSDLEAARENTVTANKNKYAWTAVVDNAEIIAYPTSAVNKMANDLYEYYKATYYQYIQYGLTLENLGITKDTCKTNAEEMIKEELVLYSIAKANGYNVSDEEYNAKVATLAETAGTDAATYAKSASKQSVETAVLYEKVMADVISSATFVEE